MHKSKIEGVMIIDHCIVIMHTTIYLLSFLHVSTLILMRRKKKKFHFQNANKKVIVIGDNRISLSPEKIYDVQSIKEQEKKYL